MVLQEVFNGVWDALAWTAGQRWRLGHAKRSGRGRYAFRDMGMLSWKCVVASDHPLAAMGTAERRHAAQLAVAGAGGYVRSLPKAYHPAFDNQRRVAAPDWESSATCLSAGLCASRWCPFISRVRESIPRRMG